MKEKLSWGTGKNVAFSPESCGLRRKVQTLTDSLEHRKEISLLALISLTLVSFQTPLLHSSPFSPYNTSRHQFNLLCFQLWHQDRVFSLIGSRTIFSHVWKHLKMFKENFETQVFYLRKMKTWIWGDFRRMTWIVEKSGEPLVVLPLEVLVRCWGTLWLLQLALSSRTELRRTWWERVRL